MPTITFDDVAEGAAYTANSSTGLTGAGDAALHGVRGVLTPTGASAGRARITISSSQVAARIYARFEGTVPAADTHLIYVQTTGSRKASAHINGAGRLRISDASGTSGIWTSAAALLPDTWYRIELVAVSGATTSTGTIKAAYYLGDSLTPVETAYVNTTANVDAGVTFTDLYLGQYSATAYQLALDSLSWDTSTTDFLGRYTPDPMPSVSPMSIPDMAGWSVVGGAGVNAVAALGDESDATYIVSPGLGANEQLLTRIPAIGNGTIYASFRCELPAGSTATQIKAEILEGATVRATRTYTLTGAWADYTMTLTSGEQAAVTNRADLWLRLTGNPA